MSNIKKIAELEKRVSNLEDRWYRLTVDIGGHLYEMQNDGTVTSPHVCVSDGAIYTSNPPQHKSKICGKYWYV